MPAAPGNLPDCLMVQIFASGGGTMSDPFHEEWDGAIYISTDGLQFTYWNGELGRWVHVDTETGGEPDTYTGGADPEDPSGVYEADEGGSNPGGVVVVDECGSSESGPDSGGENSDPSSDDSSSSDPSSDDSSDDSSGEPKDSGSIAEPESVP